MDEEDKIDLSSPTGIIEKYNDMIDNPPQVKKNSKEYKTYQEELNKLRKSYNFITGRDAFIIL